MRSHFMWDYVLCITKRSLKKDKEKWTESIALFLKGLQQAMKYSDFCTLELQHPSVRADSGHRGDKNT